MRLFIENLKFVLLELLDLSGVRVRQHVLADAPGRSRATAPVKQEKPRRAAERKPDSVVHAKSTGQTVELFSVLPQEEDDKDADIVFVTSNPNEATPLQSLAWNGYDDQEYEKAQLRTKSFTMSQYRRLRIIYLANPKTTYAEAADAFGMKKDWAKFRVPAVKKALSLAQADLDAGKPLPHC